VRGGWVGGRREWVCVSGKSLSFGMGGQGNVMFGCGGGWGLKGGWGLG